MPNHSSTHTGLEFGHLASFLQPQTNPKYQFVNALYSSLALFETTNRVLQLVENTLLASLITQRSLVQIQPPQPINHI